MPVSLEILNLYNSGKFIGGIPVEWGSMTNLRELNMANCGLDGELPYMIGLLKANGCFVNLSDNGFTLSSDLIGQLHPPHRIMKLDLSNCSLQGMCCPLRHANTFRANAIAHREHPLDDRQSHKPYEALPQRQCPLGCVFVSTQFNTAAI